MKSNNFGKFVSRAEYYFTTSMHFKNQQLEYVEIFESFNFYPMIFSTQYNESQLISTK